MAIVTVPATARRITGLDDVKTFLAGFGIDHEIWPLEDRVDPAAPAEAILAAYAPEIEILKNKGGFVTADVIDVRPETPNLDTMLAKFSQEHTHSEDEVRFILQGRGVFHVHAPAADGSDTVFAIEVGAGDLISVPVDTRHWFDLCDDRRIRAIRLFQDMSGWTPHYVEEGVHGAYEPLCLGPAWVSGSRGGRDVILFDGRGIVLDVEGTTSSISFVVDVLFTYARDRAGDFLTTHRDDDAIRPLSVAILAEAGDPWTGGDDPSSFVPRSTAAVVELIRRDAKFGPLKNLQGQIWRRGFEDRSLVADVFDDVPPALELWSGSGLDVRIYSSGSVEAQKLFFGHTAHGDLTGHFRGHYDTAIGPKRQASSYGAIAADMGLPPRQILFVSDVGQELDAARQAGLQTALADRPGNPPASSVFDHPVVTTFAQIVT